MSELREYQKKAILSDKKVVFCNWKRGNGKSEAMAYEIWNENFRLTENKNTIVVSINKDMECKVTYDFIRELFTEEMVNINIKGFRDKIEIKNQKDKIYTIKFISLSDFFNYKETRGINKVDRVYCNEFIPSKSEIEYILGFTKQVKIFTTYIDNEDFEYISDVEDKLDKKEWIFNQIEELMKEYSSIPKFDNTTMRREKVLLQIEMLNNLFDVK